jgi:hypothetical protein
MEKVKVISKIPEIEVVGGKIGPLDQGAEAEFEPWQVVVLEHHGLVEPVKELTVAELRKLLLAEERERGLAPLPHDFYLTVVQHLERLEARGAKDETQKFRDTLDGLVEARVQKLLKFASTGEEPLDVSPEEQFLVNRVSEVLSNWKGRLFKLLEKGEEAGKNDEESSRPV